MMEYINNLVASINIDSFAKPEMLFVGLILVVLLLYGLSLGRTRALVSLLGIYIAYAFINTFVYFNQIYAWFPIKSEQLIKIIVFLIAYFAVFFVLNRSLVKSRLTLKEASFFSVLVISILQLGLLIAIITNNLTDNILSRLPGIFITVFGTNIALFYWSIIPLLILFFIKNRG